MNENNFVSGFVTSNELNRAARASQSLSEQTKERFVRRGVHGRRCDLDLEFGTRGSDNLIMSRARLELYREINTIGMTAQAGGHNSIRSGVGRKSDFASRRSRRKRADFCVFIPLDEG